MNKLSCWLTLLKKGVMSNYNSLIGVFPSEPMNAYT